jgi:hypothetical protein
MSEPLWQPRSDASARVLGAGFFIGGGALVAYQLKVILDQAAEGAERVTYFLAAFGLGEMGLLLGAYWLVRGLAGYTAIRSLQQNPRQMRVLGAVAFGAILVSYVALQLWLKSLGYDE